MQIKVDWNGKCKFYNISISIQDFVQISYSFNSEFSIITYLKFKT